MCFSFFSQRFNGISTITTEKEREKWTTIKAKQETHERSLWFTHSCCLFWCYKFVPSFLPLLKEYSFHGVCERPCTYTPVRAPPGEISFHRHQETKTYWVRSTCAAVFVKKVFINEINTAFFGTYGHTVWKRVFTDAWVFFLSSLSRDDDDVIIRHGHLILFLATVDLPST